MRFLCLCVGGQTASKVRRQNLQLFLRVPLGWALLVAWEAIGLECDWPIEIEPWRFLLRRKVNVCVRTVLSSLQGFLNALQDFD